MTVTTVTSDFGIEHRAATAYRSESWAVVNLRISRGPGALVGSYPTRDEAIASVQQRQALKDAKDAMSDAVKPAAAPVAGGRGAAAVWPQSAPRGQRNTRTSNDHGVGALLGLTSSATGYSCHYCGLDYRTCDCG